MDKLALKVVGEAPAEIHVEEKHRLLFDKMLRGEVKPKFHINENGILVAILTEEE
jgi:hypothetical protein